MHGPCLEDGHLLNELVTWLLAFRTVKSIDIIRVEIRVFRATERYIHESILWIPTSTAKKKFKEGVPIKYLCNDEDSECIRLTSSGIDLAKTRKHIFVCSYMEIMEF